MQSYLSAEAYVSNKESEEEGAEAEKLTKHPHNGMYVIYGYQQTTRYTHQYPPNSYATKARMQKSYLSAEAYVSNKESEEADAEAEEKEAHAECVVFTGSNKLYQTHTIKCTHANIAP